MNVFDKILRTWLKTCTELKSLGGNRIFYVNIYIINVHLNTHVLLFCYKQWIKKLVIQTMESTN